MKGTVAALTMALAIFASTGLAGAADSPVILSHQVTGYQKGPRVATISYTFHVVNPGTKALTDLSLTVVRAQVIPRERATVNIGTLPATQRTDVKVTMEGPAASPKEFLMREPVLLSGRCADSEGKVLEFPVISYPGGAR